MKTAVLSYILTNKNKSYSTATSNLEMSRSVCSGPHQDFEFVCNPEKLSHQRINKKERKKMSFLTRDILTAFSFLQRCDCLSGLFRTLST